MCHIHTLKITEKDHLLYHSNPEAAGNCTDRRTKLRVWKPTNLHLSTGMTFFITFITNHFCTEFWRKRSALPSICVVFFTKENKLLILMKHLITFWIRTKRKAPVILQIHNETYVIQTMNLLLFVLEHHTRRFKATHSWVKCQRFLDETSHSMCLEKKGNSDLFASFLDGNRNGRWCCTRSPAFPFG